MCDRLTELNLTSVHPRKLSFSIADAYMYMCIINGQYRAYTRIGFRLLRACFSQDDREFKLIAEIHLPN